MTKPCELCGALMEPRYQDSPSAMQRGKGRFNFKTKRFCSAKCQGMAQRLDPTRNAKTRSGSTNTAKRLRPKCPCERCGETRMSEVHHRDRNYFNNALDNLERLCHWCHAKEHSAEYKAAAPRGWATRRARKAQLLAS